MKNCSRCGVVKPLDDFMPRATARDGRRGVCKGCMNEQARERWGVQRLRTLPRRYGIHPDTYRTMLDASQGSCDICKDEAALVLDHDHASGAPRGMLCHQCNTALGLMRDNPDRLRAAALYLEQRGEE